MNDLAEQIAEAVVKKMNASTPELWSVDDVADFLHLSKGHTQDRVVKSPTFPPAVEIPGSGSRPTLRWRREDVVKWATP